MSEKSTLCITNADSLLGYALIHRFLEGSSQEWKIRALCRSTRGLEQLKKKGAEIVEVDYRNEGKVREALRNTQCVFLIPEASESTEQEGQNVIRSAKQEKVEHLAVFSWIGVDRVQNERRILKQFHSLERHAQQEFSGEKHCIIRTTLFNQLFYYLWPMVEQRNELGLPIEKDKKWNTVDLGDIVDAIHRLAEQARGKANFSLGRGKKQLYQFTARESISAEETARVMGEGLGKDNLQYKQIRVEDLREYLNKIRDSDNFKERPSGGEGRGTDRPSQFPVGHYLHEQRIRLLTEFFQSINDGVMDVTTNDLSEALEREQHNLRKYFENNRDQFRRLR